MTATPIRFRRSARRPSLSQALKLSGLAAYELVRSVFDDFEEFTRLHPAFAALTVANSARRVPYATRHEGAEKFYRERGLAP